MNEFDKIVIAAIPLSDCPVKKSQELWRRERLKQSIIELMISAIIETNKLEPDGSLCKECGQVIVTKMIQPVLFINNLATDYIEGLFCEHCYKEQENDSE